MLLTREDYTALSSGCDDAPDGELFYYILDMTDFFHGCVFSIIFNKEFIVYGNRGRGMSRFSSLLNDFSGLSSRLVYSSGDYNKEMTDSRIDWEMVNSKLERKREGDLGMMIYYSIILK